MENNYDIQLIDAFPDFKERGFDIESYNKRFRQSNIIITASSSDISYPEHWGCLSIKCAFNGNEFYKVNNRMYAVNDDGFLILNDGEYYSSYIFSNTVVDSLTINFTQDIIRDVLRTLLCTDEILIDDPLINNHQTEFIQKLYKHDALVSPLLLRLRELVKNFETNKMMITEIYYSLLEKIFVLQQQVNEEIKHVHAGKDSTKKELYKRLHYVKDYIESCYMNDVTLLQLSKIGCLNSSYLLREFKKYFKITPHQYLIQKRIFVAKELLERSTLNISEICSRVGYADVSSFGKLFKKHFLNSPENFRRS